MKKRIICLSCLATVTLIAGPMASAAEPATATAKPAAAPAALQKPAWMTDLSVGVKESYDNNVLLVSGTGRMVPESSWVTTVSPKVGFNFVPLLGDQKALSALTFSYAPDFVSFHNEPVQPAGSRESYNLHRIGNTIKGKSDALSFTLDNGFNYVDGSKTAPTYFGTDSQRNAYATAYARERRNQYQDRAKAAIQYDQEKWFARLASSLTYYELLTDLSRAVGYQNYADRYDVNGGADIGYKFNPNLALTLGYRYGHQYQQTFSRALDPMQLSANNDYQRVLLGLEGKPWKWLTVSLAGGPDFRKYEETTFSGTQITHGMPVKDPEPIKYYGEANIAAEVTANDAFAFKYKGWQWVSSTGKIPYFESTFELTYRRKLTKQLNLELGGRLGSSDYTSAATAVGAPASTGVSWRRDDRMYTAIFGMTYTVSPNCTLAAGYSYDWGRNAQDDLTATLEQPRNFEHQLVSFGAQFKF